VCSEPKVPAGQQPGVRKARSVGAFWWVGGEHRYVLCAMAAQSPATDPIAHLVPPAASPTSKKARAVLLHCLGCRAQS